jgi:uncharacterized protein
MKISDGRIDLAATDLANHLSCRHLTALNLRLAEGKIAAPQWDNPHLRVLQQRGLEHEKAYIASLGGNGRTVVDLLGEADEKAATSTYDAMRRGDQVIVQAVLGERDWRGRADVLLRTERPSSFGNWSYEAADCKLARETKAETVLQLCVYSELIAALQGLEPEFFHVIRPEVGFVPESYRLTAYAAYYRVVKNSLQNSVNVGEDSYPEPVAHCEICRWWKECDGQRRRDDHLCFVAGASRLQRKELTTHGVTTLETLAKLPLPIPFKPSRGGREGYTRIREQARIQGEARDEGRLKFELLDSADGEGLCRLPAPSEGDIFLDFEGDPFVEGGELEYLFGVVTADGEGRLAYQSRWAGDRAGERAAFERLIDLIFERVGRFPDLHIYHFGGYETGAVKRLVLRYATREEEVDRLMRGDVFVDLHSITKQSMRASVEEYSLKEMEKFGDYRRRIPLPDANQARHFVEHQLELRKSLVLTDAMRAVVEGYNEDDCRATERHRVWLEKLRSDLIAGGKTIGRPAPKDAAPSEELSAHVKRVAGLFNALTRDLPAEPKDRSQAQAARWLLAHALDWHRREEKVKWWEYYRMRELPEEELYDEKAAVVGLAHRQRMPKASPKERAPVDQYAYPPQECAIREGDTLYTQDGEKFGDVLATDTAARTIDVKKPIKLDAFHPTATFAHSRYPTYEQSESILRCAEWIVAHGIEGGGDYRAARDLLLGVPPRLVAGDLRPQAGESVVQTACRAPVGLDNSVLPIQGPPGAGKTYTGARMICALLKEGKKVGITAVSHKVIRRLLDEVADAARDMHVDARCGHRKDNVNSASTPVREIGANSEALQALQSRAVNVLGGTSWLWCRQDFRDSVHCLFVDEAGQMSLANVLACAPAAANLVLLGDPQQLEQPQKGSHPEGSDISALAHLLGGKRTIAEDRGLFLAETWRLHPEICRFTSELFYEQRLVSVDGLQRQSITAPSLLSGAGLWFAPVMHDGNRSHSNEEIEVVSRIVAELTKAGSTWTDSKGTVRPLTVNDILVVAPYNDQVNRLMERLKGARVGTVDKFQGQQAAVVIYSMTTSTPEDAPRGMEFLYDPNRFNVATSRARCACIVIASPGLFSPECRTPRQMELANVLCRYGEMSSIVEVASGNRA